MEPRQEEQLNRYLNWYRDQDAREGPVRLTTLLQPEQQARIEWIRHHAENSILEVGCSWGYILGVVNGVAGVDKEPMNIELAKALQPDKIWMVGDALNLDALLDKSFDTVILAEILEHLEWDMGVKSALVAASRVCRGTILITVPEGEDDTDEATSFKHQWLCDEEHVKVIVDTLAAVGFNSEVEHRHGFVLIRSDEEGNSGEGE